MRQEVTIQSPIRSYIFDFYACKSRKPEEQDIEESFYIKYAGEVHKGVHFEMEIRCEEILHHPLMKKVPSPLHVHLSEKNNRSYICWTGNIPDYPSAIRMLKAWCVGTVYTLETGVDFATILASLSIEVDNFKGIRDFFKNNFFIEVIKIEDGD